MSHNSEKCCLDLGYDLLLGSIAVFYVVMAPYTKVEESFNIQVHLLILLQLISCKVFGFRAESYVFVNLALFLLWNSMENFGRSEFLLGMV